MLILQIAIITGCNSNSLQEEIEVDSITSGTDGRGDSKTESQILDLLYSLPEVKELDSYTDSISNHKKGTTLLLQPPENSGDDYHIMAGYNTEDHFSTTYHFYVNPKTMEIKVLDVLSDSILPIEEWRKRQNY